MVPLTMTPTRLRERFEEGQFDAEEFLEALEYVRDDGRSR